MNQTIYKYPHDVTGVTDIFRSLVDHNVAAFCIDEGLGPKRVVINLFDHMAEEIMVAMEGSGCIFLTAEDSPNPYKFIEQGFQIRAAQIICIILGGLARSFASAKSNQPRQIEDKRS